ncbi:hypothetical protein [Polynucleobacter asymbioticus]|uniref:hypothetical protein n=1 Tax=Polynucleobacter asymbioticus TaxID=576611 RepID=UPI0019001DE2|nr:hypothetical protein [Polynucleobacter asymbioticus]
MSAIEAPFLWGCVCLEISTGLNMDDSENSGLLTDITIPSVMLRGDMLLLKRAH